MAEGELEVSPSFFLGGSREVRAFLRRLRSWLRGEAVCIRSGLGLYYVICPDCYARENPPPRMWLWRRSPLTGKIVMRR